jgi:hypothetical protein
MSKTLTVEALLTNLVDYAGLFPPAGLDMQSAVRNYAIYRGGEHAWMLGRFVLPATRLLEFEQAAEKQLLQPADDEEWELSVLASDDLEADLGRIAEFDDRNNQLAIVDTIELKADTAGAIERAVNAIDGVLMPYVEIPIKADPSELIELIAEYGVYAKVRTGGLTADGIPSSYDLARFINICAELDVPFKATAGLHHPLRSINRLTYEPNSPSAMMHGFLNVFLAAAFAQNGMSVDRLVEVIEETSPDAFKFDEGSVTWRDEMVVRGQIRNARNLLAISFGSCSFEEPVEDLRRIGLL